jgi:hypothetical protein
MVGIGFVSESESYVLAAAKACPAARRMAGVTGEDGRSDIDCPLKGLIQGVG